MEFRTRSLDSLDMFSTKQDNAGPIFLAKNSKLNGSMAQVSMHALSLEERDLGSSPGNTTLTWKLQSGRSGKAFTLKAKDSGFNSR